MKIRLDQYLVQHGLIQSRERAKAMIMSGVVFVNNQKVDKAGEMIKEDAVLFGVPYRRSLTTVFPRFLKVMAQYHEADIRRYFADVFGFQGSVGDSVEKMIALFEEIGVPMYFEGEVSMQACAEVPVDSVLSNAERFELLSACMKR